MAGIKEDYNNLRINLVARKVMKKGETNLKKIDAYRSVETKTHDPTTYSHHCLATDTSAAPEENGEWHL